MASVPGEHSFVYLDVRFDDAPFVLANGHIVDAGVAAIHEPVGVELPHLVAVRSVPLSRSIVPLVLEAYGDTVVAERTLRAKGIAVKVASSIGAGDSFLGGLIWSLSRTADLEKAFRYAMAAGAAALLSAGTALCQPADVERFCKDVNITPV